jgi:hypothetical protein
MKDEITKMADETSRMPDKIAKNGWTFGAVLFIT